MLLFTLSWTGKTTTNSLCKKSQLHLRLHSLSLFRSRSSNFQVIVTIVFAISAISKTPSTASLPPPSLTLLNIHYSIIAIYNIIHFPSPNQNASNKFKMHRLAPSPALLSNHTSLLHSNRFIGSRSNNAYNTKSYPLLNLLNKSEPTYLLNPLDVELFFAKLL